MQVNPDFTMDIIKPAQTTKTAFAGICSSKKSTSQLSFKGLPKISEAVAKFGEDFGDAAGRHFETIIKQADRSGLEIKANDSITFHEESFGKRALDILIYPVKGMPIDLANAVLKGLKKIPWFKNSSGLNELFDKSVFKNRRLAVENKSNVAAIKHYFEMIGNGDGKYKRFIEGHKRLAPLVPNYNSETERSLNRLVTGLIPAFFLANDAYNLSMYMNNDKDLAKKEKKRRFNQELGRIGIASVATYGLMSMFAKQCNKSIGLTAAITAGMVLVSEVLGRTIAGNPVLPVSAQKAKEYAQKRNEAKQNNTSESVTQQATENKPAKKGFLTLSNILKTIGGLMVFGFAAEKVSNIPKIKTHLKNWGEKYKNLYMKDFIVSRKEFLEIIKKLKDNGFGEIANRYELLTKEKKGENIKMGSMKSKPKYIIIHQILTFPVRFAWDVLNLPYKKLIKPLMGAIKEEAKKAESIKSDKVLQNGIQFLQKIKDTSNPEFKDKFNRALVSSFDNLTKSDYQNSDLNVVVKTAQSTVTTGFLIADNYNMVMIDSQGENKDLAEQKAKERAVQRGTRLTYEAFVMKMVLDMFAGLCSSSLLGALGVSGALRVVTEMVERKAVGLPIHESTKEEIQENEKIHMSATGIKGSYFRAMAKLAGKKSFAEKENIKNS